MVTRNKRKIARAREPLTFIRVGRPTLMIAAEIYDFFALIACSEAAIIGKSFKAPLLPQHEAGYLLPVDHFLLVLDVSLTLPVDIDLS